jgi:secreted PhoX family phosphatase
MAQNTNLPIVNPADSFDQRVQDYFTNYFTAPIRMTDQEYEAAKSFFVARTNNEQAAAALTAATVQAANELGLFIVDVIKEFESTTDLKSAVPTFLNMSRSGRSLLGYEANITPNENIARQVSA